MGFNNLNSRSTVLIFVAGLMLVITIITRLISHGSTTIPNLQPDTPSNAQIVIPLRKSAPSLSPEITSFGSSIKDAIEEDNSSIKEMKEQMDNDRIQQKKIKMLKLQLEQINIQLEQQKARSEINKLEKEDTNVIDNSNEQGQEKYPDIKVIYIGGTDEERKAILAINGTNYSVKEKNKPVKNVEVISITNSAVLVHFNLPQDLTATIEYKPD